MKTEREKDHEALLDNLLYNLAIKTYTLHIILENQYKQSIMKFTVGLKSHEI